MGLSTKPLSITILIFLILVVNLHGELFPQFSLNSDDSTHSFTYRLQIKDTEDIKEIDSEITRLMAEGYVPSLAAAIIQKDNISWIKGYGAQPDIENTYLIGSITKTFTSTAIMQLIEKGLADLDDDVNLYLPFNLRNPNYPNTPITFRMLLSHTSSLNIEQLSYSLICSQDWFTRLTELNVTYPPEAWLDIHPGNHQIEWNETVKVPDYLPEYFAENGSYYTPEVWGNWMPGSMYAYCNPAYDLLAYLVERIANQSIESYLSGNIFDPLNMTRTGFNLTHFDESTLMIPHTRVDQEIYAGPPYSILSYGAGGLRSSVTDLAKYIAAHMNYGEYKGVRILKQETSELMQAKFVPLNPETPDWAHYGLGWFHYPIYNPLQGHSGLCPGFASFMRYMRWEDCPDSP